ncbi:MAG: GNAT family N-acetyltransferase [Anaerolineae bacterium]|nr:GNAT family N-acetyltransferase [Anaerolineae bacterium]
MRTNVPAFHRKCKFSPLKGELFTEAARAILAYAFDDMGLAAVNGSTGPENIASKRVMEKIGMCYVGLNDDGGPTFTLTQEVYKLDREWS